MRLHILFRSTRSTSVSGPPRGFDLLYVHLSCRPNEKEKEGRERRGQFKVCLRSRNQFNRFPLEKKKEGKSGHERERAFHVRKENREFPERSNRCRPRGKKKREKKKKKIEVQAACVRAILSSFGEKKGESHTTEEREGKLLNSDCDRRVRSQEKKRKKKRGEKGYFFS